MMDADSNLSVRRWLLGTKITNIRSTTIDTDSNLSVVFEGIPSIGRRWHIVPAETKPRSGRKERRSFT